MASSRTTDGRFTSTYLGDTLAALGARRDTRFLVAVSGGGDSQALAHALAKLDAPARAAYVDHGLHDQSAAFGEQTARALARVDLPCRVLAAPVPPGPNVEARAREARYAALARALGDNEVLLTAHHQDDQALTFLLQLMRGAGVEGLAAMPASRPLGKGAHWRPLLDVPAAALRDYVTKHRLPVMTDPSNADRRFDRNYLRHDVVPLLQSRWPAMARTVSRSAAHCAAAAAQLHAQSNPPEVDDAVSVTAVAARARPEAAGHALRRLIKRHDLSPPPTARLIEFVRQLGSAAPDRQPELALGAFDLRRCRDWLYLVESPVVNTLGGARLYPGQALTLPGVAGTLIWRAGPAKGRALDVVFRRGGERFGRGPTRRLKSFLQDQGVLPWRRGGVPLIMDGDDVVAIADLWAAPGFEGAFDWHPAARFIAVASAAPSNPPAGD